MEEALPSLAAWEGFYVIIGSSAAVLTGLQFVVIVLGAELNALVSMPAVRAFGTPTVVHFCAALLVSAILSAPWHSLLGPALSLGVGGMAGVAYAARVVMQARRQTDYVPVFEDWLWHGALPLVAYATLLAAAIALRLHPAPSLFVIGGTAMFLLLVGIHNAWDTVTYMALERQRRPEGPADQG